MTSYAAQKGRAAPSAPAATGNQLPPLTEAQQEAIQANKEFILEHMPDLLDVLRTLRESGIDIGWRNIKRCSLLDDNNDE